MSSGLLSPVFGGRAEQTKDDQKIDTGAQNYASSQGGFSSQKGKQNVTFKLQSMKELTFDKREKQHPLYLTDAYQKYLKEKDILVEKMGAEDLFNLEDETGISQIHPVGSCFVKEKLHLQAEQRKKDRIRQKMELKMQRMKGNKGQLPGDKSQKTSEDNKYEEIEYDEVGDPEEDLHRLESDHDALKRELKNLQNENELLKQKVKEEKEVRQTLQFKIQKSAMNQELIARSQYLKGENFYNKASMSSHQSTFMYSVSCR